MYIYIYIYIYVISREARSMHSTARAATLNMCIHTYISREARSMRSTARAPTLYNPSGKRPNSGEIATN